MQAQDGIEEDKVKKEPMERNEYQEKYREILHQKRIKTEEVEAI